MRGCAKGRLMTRLTIAAILTVGILAGLGLAALATADHGCAHDWDEVDL